MDNWYILHIHRSIYLSTTGVKCMEQTSREGGNSLWFGGETTILSVKLEVLCMQMEATQEAMAAICYMYIVSHSFAIMK